MRRSTLVALLAVPIAVLVLSACSSDDTYPTSTAVVSGADDAAAAAFQVVNDTYDLFNTGDIEAWVEVRDSGSAWPSEEVRSREMPAIIEEAQSKYDEGSRYVETECVSQGLGSWPGVADEGDVTGYYFTCTTALTKESAGRGLSQVDEFYKWVVNEGVVVAVTSTF